MNYTDIDVVITWVNDKDPEWQKEKYEYVKDTVDDTNSNLRYRDWDNLQFFFRGICKNMPWVRKVHFVTWGHIPSWLDTSEPRLNIVKHTDFIPDEYLPTFNSNAIELNIHRIPGLAEQFIVFNDDMLTIHGTKPEDFFLNGKVLDMALVSPQPIYRNSIMNIELNNMKIINDYFGVSDIKKNIKNWTNIRKYGKNALRTMIFCKFQSIIGIFQPHIPYSFFKSTFDELWEKEEAVLDSTCKNKFRTTEDVNIWLMRSWQLLSGKFVPRSHRFGHLISASDFKSINYYLNDAKCKMVCINDDDSVVDFEKTKEYVNNELIRLLPEKCSFEK